MKRRTIFFLSLGLLAALFAACSVRPVSNAGTGMAPTLGDGDKILMDESPSELKRGDIVIFLYPKDPSKWYIKRIVGLPGEKVEIRAGKVLINENPLDEPYVDETRNRVKADFAPVDVPADQYYVLGDNRDNSSDSRYWGTLPRNSIKGRYARTYSKASEKNAP